MGVRHPFVSLVLDMGGPTYVQPTHWNAPLLAPPFLLHDLNPGLAPASFGVPSTAGPTGFEFPANTAFMRTLVDVTQVTTLQLYAGVSSVWALGSTALRFQYSPSGFPGSWYSFDATGGSAPFVNIASGLTGSIYLLGSNGPRWGPAASVSAAAKALPQPLNCRVAGYGGNGSGVALGNIDVFGT